MLKLLLLLAVVLAVAWIIGRGKRGPGRADTAKPRPPAPAAPAEMLACSHCGVHLPRGEAAFDAAGHPFCSAEHRVAGPR
jgi:uncharacterized protein